MTSTMRALLAALVVFCVGVPAAPALAGKSKPAASSKAKSKIKARSGKRAKSAKSVRIRVVAPPDPGFLARDAYYSGDVDKAYPLAVAAGERWVAALSAYRLNNPVDAFQRFQSVADDMSEDAWVRSGAAFWAARTASAAGRTDQESPYLKLAASMPWTFYGMIAEAQLGLNPVVSFAHTVLSPDVQVAETTDLVAQLIRANTASSEALETGEMSPIADIHGFNPSHYPVPLLAPIGGFTIDPALVYSLIRQESRFNAGAVSPAGAIGLMQLMPATAAITAGDDSYRTDRDLLRDPQVNVRLGQDYINKLASSLVGDDMMMVIAAYNGGPGAVAKTMDRVGFGADPLLMIESLPAKETRDYVEKVMAGYWIYRRQFGQQTPSLDAIAGGVRRVSINYDRSHPARSVEQAALAPRAAARPASAVVPVSAQNQAASTAVEAAGL
jgi:soluble lytic murein transglycosylase